MKVLNTLLILLVYMLSGCAGMLAPEEQADRHILPELQVSAELKENPLLQSWNTPYGVPPFDRIHSQDYLPALREGIRLHKQEIAFITDNPHKPTFNNTIVALEKSGSVLQKTANVFYSVYSANSDDIIRETIKEFAPQQAAHMNEIGLSSALYKRVADVYKQKSSLDLNSEQERLLDETYHSFLRAGVNLSDEDQTRLKAIDQQLAVLTSKFSENLLKETNNFEIIVDNKKDLGNLPESLVAVAAGEAEKKGYPGKWLFTLQRPSINPFLQYSPNRELRKILFDGYAMRGNNGNKQDNNIVINQIIELRVERAHLLGFETLAEQVLQNRVAQNPVNVMKLLDRIWQPALEVAKNERDALQAMMHKDGIKGTLQASDWRYYAEKVRKARYDFDENTLRPYFEVNAVRDGLFSVTQRLWGITYHARDDLPKWHDDQQVFEVREANGDLLGIVYLDFYIRESKRGGAWMTAMRVQNRIDGDVKPIVTTNFNFPPPSENIPSLISYRDAETLFHEFGHAIHGLFSDVTYPSLAGTALPRDFVEYPSQVMENWLGQPEVLKQFARHYKTGEVIPDDLIQKLHASKKFNQGFATVEYMAASYLDMAWHSLTSVQQTDPETFEKKVMKDIGLIEQIIPRYRSGYFSHIFSGGYYAGYYGYLWSEVYDADTFSAFEENGLFDQETAQRFRKEVLSRGNSRPGLESFRAFRGRDADIKPLLKRRGLM